MELMPKLTPFWYTPETQEQEGEVEFRLRPLTQAQLVELDEMQGPDKPIALVLKPTTMYAAARMAVVGIRGVVDGEGNELKWTEDVAEAMPRHLMVQAGWRLLEQARGRDWDALVAESKALVQAKLDELGLRSLDEPEGADLVPEPAGEPPPEEDPVKN